MPTLTLRKAAVAAVVPLSLWTLSACGGNGSSATATDTNPTAPASSGSTPPASTDDSTPAAGQTVDSAQFLDTVKAAAKAITTAKFQMQMDFSGQTVSANGALDMTGSSPAMQMSMDLTGMGTPTDLRLVDGAIYIQVPGQAGKFMKMDLNDKNSPLGGLSGTLGNLDPQALMDQMKPEMFKKVTYVGSDSVGKHYTVELDTTNVPMIGDLRSADTSSIPKTIDYDMWLDDQGRMAQFKMQMPKLVSMTMQYTDFGADVHVTAPDPSDVESMPSIPGASASS